MANELEITRVALYDDGTSTIVEIELSNRIDRTLHFYSVARNLQYDIGSKTLRLYLTDRNTKEIHAAGMFVRPRFGSVDGLGTTKITLTLPRFATRLDQSGGKQVVPRLESSPIHEALHVEVHVAWSDQPFYPDPRPRKEPATARQQLIEWEKGIAVGSGERQNTKSTKQ